VLNQGGRWADVTPEAYQGGPIALVEDGDKILIDVNEGRLELLVEEDVLAQRRKNWKLPKKEIPGGYLKLYAAHAGSANRGAVIEM
jgi:dihydroxy-acid dehydratase